MRARRCLRSARLSMYADVLYLSREVPPEHAGDGRWENYQNPITKEITRRWVPATGQDNPNTPDYDESVNRTIQCEARGLLGGGGAGLNSVGQEFGDLYKATEVIRMTVPAHEYIPNDSRITNVRSQKNGRAIWRDKEGRPTTFNVNGSVPTFNERNEHIETVLLLEVIDVGSQAQ